MQTENFTFKSVGIASAIAEFMPEIEGDEMVQVVHREQFVKALQGRIRRESAGWAKETVADNGKRKELKQPKAVQKVGWGETPTLTLGQHQKTVVPSTMAGQLVLLDEAYAQLEKHGIGYFAGIRADSYLANKLTEFAKEFKPAPVPQS